MGMQINYWDCKFSDYEEDFDNRYYGCTHEKGCGTCDLSNKYCDATDFCELAEME